MRRLVAIAVCTYFTATTSTQAKGDVTATNATSAQDTSAPSATTVATVHKHTFSGCTVAPALLQRNYNFSPADDTEPLPKPIKNRVRIPALHDMTVHPFKFPPSIYDQQHYKPSRFVPDNSQLYLHSNIRQTTLNGRAPGVVSTPYLPEFVGRKTH